MFPKYGGKKETKVYRVGEVFPQIPFFFINESSLILQTFHGLKVKCYCLTKGMPYSEFQMGPSLSKRVKTHGNIDYSY